MSAALHLSAATIPALIIDGQNNHDFRATTPHLKLALEQTGLFSVEVASAPAKGRDMAQFKPAFARYRVVVSNYNGEPWSQETREAFQKFVREGGGFVSVHAADNAFPQWLEYNQMIAVGGWDRTEKSGPYLRWRDSQWVREQVPGASGSHGKQHEFVVETRAPEHPIMAGLPARWRHAKDELYDRLRGPAENVTVLASALSAKETGGSGEQASGETRLRIRRTSTMPSRDCPSRCRAASQSPRGDRRSGGPIPT